MMSQIAAHAAFGGVVPEIAARAHVEIVDLLIARALAKAGMAARTSTAWPPQRGQASSAG